MILEIKVVPSSGQNKWVIDKSGKLKCYLKSPPERNLANFELISLLSKALKIPQNKVMIVSGQTSRTKRLDITHEIPYPELLALLKIEPQLSLFEKE